MYDTLPHFEYLRVGNSWVYKICYQGWNSRTLVTHSNVPNVQGGKRNKITHCSVKAPTIGSHIVHGQNKKITHCSVKAPRIGSHIVHGQNKKLHIVVWMPQQLDILGHRVSFHIDKTNKKKFQKIYLFFKFWNYIFSIIYYNIVIWVVKLFRM